MDTATALTAPLGMRVQPRLIPIYEAFGTKKSMAEWCKEYNVKRTTVQERMRLKGYTLEEALKLSKHSCSPKL
jgi:hypothetical protein